MASSPSNGSLVPYILSIHQSIADLKELVGQKWPHLTLRLIELTDQLVVLLDFFAQIAPTYDYQDIPCNGMRSVIRFMCTFFKLATKINSQKEMEQVFSCFDLTAFALRQLVRIHEIKVAINKRSLDSLDDIVNYDEANNAIKQIHKESFMRVEDEIRGVMKTFLNSRFFCLSFPVYRSVSSVVVRMHTSIINESSFLGYKYLLSSHDSVIDRFVESTSTTAPHNIAKFIRWVDKPIVRWSMRAMVSIKELRKNFSVKKSHKVTVTSKFEIGLDETKKYTVLQVRKVPKLSSVKFRLNRLNEAHSPGHNGKVILYVHGGGFLGPAAEGAELMYINDFCHRVPGVTFINIDYSPAPESTFPTQLQELLDLYIWLTSETTDVVTSESVERVIGFKPSDTYIAGDSAGANMVLGLLLVINDIHRFAYDTSIVMPKAAIGLFGKYIIAKEISSSLIMAAADPIVPYPIMVKMSCFARFRKYKHRADGQVDWSLVRADLTKDRVMVDDDFEVEPCPYLQPLMYQFFDSQPLKSVHLYLLGLDFCPLLDETIDLAKLWKGPVTFTHLDNCPHGGCYFALVDPSATHQIRQVCGELLRRALGLAA